MRFWRALLLIVLAALALRVGYVALAKHDEPRLGDQIYYNVAANQLAAATGSPIRVTARRPRSIRRSPRSRSRPRRG